jgi:hypothetical protein
MDKPQRLRLPAQIFRGLSDYPALDRARLLQKALPVYPDLARKFVNNL